MHSKFELPSYLSTFETVSHHSSAELNSRIISRLKAKIQAQGDGYNHNGRNQDDNNLFR